MDFPYLVYALIQRFLRAPSLHYVVLGGALFIAIPSSWETGPTLPKLVIPASQIESAYHEYELLNARPLTAAERKTILEYLIDQEVLHAYAKRLGLDKDPVVRRRLAQIATFVSENPDEAKSDEERADEAVLLGLDEDDLVVRRVLIDSVKRLIRASVLVQEPSDSLLETYLRDHATEFRQPSQLRLSQVTVDAFRHKAQLEHDAAALLGELRSKKVPPEASSQYGDRGFVEARLPLLTERELERRFGHRFTSTLVDIPAGSWEGPIPSRYGMHLIFIEERVPERIPNLNEVRDLVRAKVREQLADSWLSKRLVQLRAEFAIQIPENVGSVQKTF